MNKIFNFILCYFLKYKQLYFLGHSVNKIENKIIYYIYNKVKNE